MICDLSEDYMLIKNVDKKIERSENRFFIRRISGLED